MVCQVIFLIFLDIVNIIWYHFVFRAAFHVRFRHFVYFGINQRLLCSFVVTLSIFVMRETSDLFEECGVGSPLSEANGGGWGVSARMEGNRRCDRLRLYY